MNQRIIQTLFSLISSTVCGTMLGEEEREFLLEDVISKLKDIADSHDITHLLAYGLEKNAVEVSAELARSIVTAVYRYEQLNYEFERLCEVLESAQIPFIPLKGTVIRDMYPEPWMRTSCDVDILIHKEDIDRASAMLTEEYGYVCTKKGSHDISFYTPGKKHIELHYNLVEDGIARESSDVLRTVWDTASVREGYNFWYQMTDEMFYFYHIAHMAKHFENGGCGIRPLLDLWILDSIEDVQAEKRDELIGQGNLQRFTEMSRKLCKSWFGNGEADELTDKMGEYIICGGVYGTSENRIAVQQQKKGGKLQYAMSQIFLPYETIKFHYPILQKHRWLLPFMEVRRWFKLVFLGHAKRTLKELKFNNSINKTQADEISSLLKNIGL